MLCSVGSTSSIFDPGLAKRTSEKKLRQCASVIMKMEELYCDRKVIAWKSRIIDILPHTYFTLSFHCITIFCAVKLPQSTSLCEIQDINIIRGKEFNILENEKLPDQKYVNIT